MIKSEDIKKKITDSGLKVTHQRIAVYEALANSKEHPTAEMLTEHVNEKYPYISTATVYKTLDTFVQKGLIFKVKTDSDKMRYDASTEQHHHIYCKDTGEIKDYHDEELNRLLKEHFRKKNIENFEIEDIKLQIMGHHKNSKK